MILYGVPSKIEQLPYSAAFWAPSSVVKMPRAGHLYTRHILEPHGPKHLKMQRNNCYQTFLGSTPLPPDYMLAGFRRHLMGKALRNVCHCDVA